MSLDTFIIDRLDKVTLKLQKKGIPLTSIHVYAMAAVLFTDTADTILRGANMYALLIGGTIWGLWLFAYQAWERQNRDYYTSTRKTEQLNARAVSDRSFQWVLRIMWWGVLISGVLASLFQLLEGKYVLGINNVFRNFAPWLCWYLNCCTFCGLGEFAKEKKVSLAALPQGSH